MEVEEIETYLLEIMKYHKDSHNTKSGDQNVFSGNTVKFLLDLMPHLVDHMAEGKKIDIFEIAKEKSQEDGELEYWLSDTEPGGCEFLFERLVSITVPSPPRVLFL